MPPQAQQSSHRKACKECRRLRLGCDREVPCHNCKRRGCSAICPEGTLEKGARSRSTIIIELQETISELRKWNSLLEEALAILQASISSEPHPLLSLRDRSVAGKTTAFSATSSSAQSSRAAADEDAVLDALGTFSIHGDQGEMSMYGPIPAATEYLFRGNPSIPPDLTMQGRSDNSYYVAPRHSPHYPGF